MSIRFVWLGLTLGALIAAGMAMRPAAPVGPGDGYAWTVLHQEPRLPAAVTADDRLRLDPVHF